MSDLAKTPSLNPLRRCVYCGHPLDGGKKRVCAKHKGLPALDEHWDGFIGDECGCPDCITAWAERQPPGVRDAVRALG